MDRAERAAHIRAYKETPRPMGVYRLRNVADRRSLVGESVDAPARLNRLRAQLRLGAHPSRELQEDWRRLGPEGFVFEVLDTLAPAKEPSASPADDLAALKAMWLERLAAEGERFY